MTNHYHIVNANNVIDILCKECWKIVLILDFNFCRFLFSCQEMDWLYFDAKKNPVYFPAGCCKRQLNHLSRVRRDFDVILSVL